MTFGVLEEWVLVARNNDDMIDLDIDEVLSICFSDGTPQSLR